MIRGLPLYLRVDPRPRPKQLVLFASLGRQFAPYQQWEDYRSGMFRGRLAESFVMSAIEVLSVEGRCVSSMRRVILEWPIAASVNLTNTGLNRRAWVGQAACCLEVGATAHETKRAWWQLTEAERTQANRYADEVIALWQTAHE